MKTFKGKFILPVIVFLAMVGVIACHKETSSSSAGNIPPGQSKLSLFLTDGPYDFQQVLIDIKSVQVLVDTCHQSGNGDEHHDGDDEGDDHHNQGGGQNEDGDHHDGDNDHESSNDTCNVWTDLQINPGIYDMLTLRNGNDTLLGASFIPNGKILKIKITLGADNSVMVDSVVYPLKIRDNKDYVIISVRKENIDSIAQNNFHLLVDFNLAKSIKFDDGTYWLNPCLRVFSEKHTGSIEGEVRPEGSYGMIRAANATDTAYALPQREDGEFKIRGLNEGTYSVWIQGINGFNDTTINDVMVHVGRETELGKITLHK